MATVYDPIVAPLDPMGVGKWRRWATAAVRGRVLELGVGTGLNLGYYRAAEQVVAIDPDGASLDRAQARARRSPIPVTLLQAGGERLPFPDGVFDAVVGTLVLCTVPDVAQTLGEVRRVLKCGGTLRLVEHVRGHRPLVGKVLDWATPAWSQVAGGCQLNRDTVAAVAGAGFLVRTVDTHVGGWVVSIDAAVA